MKNKFHRRSFLILISVGFSSLLALPLFSNTRTIKKLENTLTAVKFRKYKKDTKGMSITNRIKWLNKNK